MSTLKVNTISNAAGSASTSADNVINGSAKAWVNFNGTGTVAIRAGYNVSSITDNGTGIYQVNLTTGMPDTKYVLLMLNNNWGIGWSQPIGSQGAFEIRLNHPSVGYYDASEVYVAVFR